MITELEAYRSIPGTTPIGVRPPGRELRRDRLQGLLKGVIVGTAISQHLVVDRGDAERRIRGRGEEEDSSEILSELERV